MGIKVYIIVLWHNGIPHFLQNNNKLAWCFSDDIKPYFRLGNAINAAKKLRAKYQFDKIRIYNIPFSLSFSSSSVLKGELDKYVAYEIRKD